MAVVLFSVLSCSEKVNNKNTKKDAIIVTLALPILSAKAPKIGANMPHINICIPIAKPNSVIVHCKSFTKKSVNIPKTMRSPMNTATMKHAEISVKSAVLLGKNFSLII